MKNTLLFIFIALTISVYAEHKILLYYEQTNNGYIVYADNEEFCPCSVKVDFVLNNLESSTGNNKVFILPAKSKKNLIAELKVIDKKKGYKFSSNCQTNYGDDSKNNYDQDFEYYLPFKKNVSYLVWQGYNGAFSHQNINALDFTMPIGTEIHAARDGIVVKVIQNNNKSCKQKDCAQYNNYILIYHNDGTFTEYTHIKKNGSRVKEGDAVQIGQLIGYSGNIGWSSGPHLHFAVFLQKLNKRETIKTRFLVGNGEQSELLDAMKEYKKEY